MSNIKNKKLIGAMLIAAGVYFLISGGSFLLAYSGNLITNVMFLFALHIALGMGYVVVGYNLYTNKEEV